jgi:hypothetical protein
MIAGAASAADLASDRINAFRSGVTTKAEVIASFGKPLAENHNPDGRSTAVYDYNELVAEKDRTPYERAVVFLFDPQNLFVNAKVYAKKPPGAESPPTGASAAATDGGLQDENVLLPQPEGFKVGFHNRQTQMETTEYLPAGETVDDWSRMITEQIFFRRRNVDPDDLPNFMVKSWSGACPGGVGERTGRTNENGYPVATWRFRCPMNTQTHKPETMWMKVISGADALYSVQYAYRRAPSDDLARPAMAYLQGVKVCDTRTPEHPCPALKPVAR